MKAIVLFLVLFLTGCTTLSGAGATAADQVRDIAEWTICQAITVGAWARAYATSRERIEAWSVLCAPHLRAAAKAP